jgi:hypothetical protein
MSDTCVGGQLAHSTTFGIDLDDWPDDVRIPGHAVHYETARELLGNVVAHAARRSVTVGLPLFGGRAHRAMADDDVVIDDEAVQRSMELGHIGLASHSCEVASHGVALLPLLARFRSGADATGFRVANGTSCSARPSR